MTPLLPLEPQLIANLAQYFQKVSVLTTGVVGLLFIARASFLLISLAAPNSYGELLKDTILYFVLINLFPHLLILINKITGRLATSLYWEPSATENGTLDFVFSSLKKANPILGVLFDFSPMLMCHLAQAISTLLISILVAIGPIVILLNSMLDYNKGVTVYFTTIISFCLWPVLWNLLGSLSNEILDPNQGTSLMRILFWCSTVLIQFISPLICIFLFTSLAPGKAISFGVTKVVSNISKWRF